MPDPFSYYSIGVAAFVLAYFMGSFERPAYICIGFAALFYLSFANVGYADIGVSPYTMTASHFFLSNIATASMWAFAGTMLCRGLNNMKFLNHYTLLITEKRSDQRKLFGGRVWPFWVFLILVLGSLFLYELRDIPYFVRTFLGVGVLVGAWFFFYFLYRNETAYYYSDKSGVTSRQIVWTLCWIPGLVTLVYGLVYLLLEFFAQDGYPTTFGMGWFDNHWNFYTSLIVPTVPIVLGMAFWRYDWKKRSKLGKPLGDNEQKDWVQSRPLHSNSLSSLTAADRIKL